MTTKPRAPDRPSIDLRTEVTLAPTDEMWSAMKLAAEELTAPYLDDVRTIALEAKCAELTGLEAAVLTPTTTMANVIALLTLCERGSQVILGASSHLFWWEKRHVSSLSGAATRLVGENANGELPLDEVESALRGGTYALRIPTSVIALENTHNFCGGAWIASSYVRELVGLAREFEAAVFVDGARIFNAAVGQGVPLSELTEQLDAVSLSLNKGIGAPYGGVLCGSKDVIRRAREHLATLGGHSVHRSGIFAAAALTALEEGRWEAQLARDHENARWLAEELAAVPDVVIDLDTIRTNLVPADFGERSADEIVEKLWALGVGAWPRGPTSIRFVTHRGFDATQIPAVRSAVETAVASTVGASVLTDGDGRAHSADGAPRRRRAPSRR